MSSTAIDLRDTARAMPDENVEIVRRFLDQAHEAPDAVWGIFDDEVDWEVGTLSIPDFPGRFQGPNGVREFFRRWVGPFDDWGYDVEELIEGRDVIAVRIHQWGRGKGSGATVEDRFWQVWTMRNGKAVRVSHHRERPEALDAVELSQQGTNADGS